MLFDSHCHLHDAKLDRDRAEVVMRAREAGVHRILTLATTPDDAEKALAVAREFADLVIVAAGVHPGYIEAWQPDTEARLRALLALPEVKVLGEIGLDRYWSKDPAIHARQDVAFRAQLRLARELGLGVSIHARDADDAVLEVLRDERGSEIGGVLHCFSGNYEHAEAGVEMGFYLGIGGSATYPKSADLRETLKRIGIAHLVVETDAPYLPPQPRRGQRNEPGFVAYTARLIAETLGVSYPIFEEMTYQNTLKAFRLGG